MPTRANHRILGNPLSAEPRGGWYSSADTVCNIFRRPITSATGHKGHTYGVVTRDLTTVVSGHDPRCDRS